MSLSLRRSLHLLAWTIATIALPASAQETPAQTPDPAAFQALAKKAADFVLKHELLDPNVLVPNTGKRLGDNGTWSVGKQKPATCPPNTDSCVRVLYRVPDTPVSCEWTVLIRPDGSTGVILEQNLDSVRYLLRVVPTAELAPLIVTRPMQFDTRGQGTVEVTIIVGTTGDPTKTIAISGPDTLRTPSAEIAKQWVFKPLIVGNRAIPFTTNIKLTFGNGRITSDP
jgi:Gram-negative bacterial TonB protein C-terminal